MQMVQTQPMLIFGHDMGWDIEAMEFEDEDLAISSSNIYDTKFDVTVGHIEDIIIGDDFQMLQNDFMEKYYTEFEDTDENKFIYTDIHKEYTDLIERYIGDELAKRIPGFSMEEFTKQLESRKEELDGEVFEMLLTFSDFLAFKEMFIDYRASKEGRVVDFSEGIMITPVSTNCVMPTLEIKGFCETEKQ